LCRHVNEAGEGLGGKAGAGALRRRGSSSSAQAAAAICNDRGAEA